MLFVFIFTAGLSLAEDTADAQNNTSLANDTILADNMSLADNTSSTEDLATPVASPENTTNTSAPSLKYIWSITGVEDDPVIMALDQDGSDLFGQAKYEPDGGDPWNGIVDGSISGDQVKLTITAQKGNSLESIKLNGAFADDALTGKFTKISEGKVIGRGEFSAMWTTPDISSYTPAKVTEATPQKETTIAKANTETNDTTPATATETEETSKPPVKLGGKTKYVDVHEYADKIGPGGDLSGVPPGMG